MIENGLDSRIHAVFYTLILAIEDRLPNNIQLLRVSVQMIFHDERKL